MLTADAANAAHTVSERNANRRWTGNFTIDSSFYIEMARSGWVVVPSPGAKLVLLSAGEIHAAPVRVFGLPHSLCRHFHWLLREH
jgi:hypothetical protein